jgi:hypothetical protein
MASVANKAANVAAQAARTAKSAPGDKFISKGARRDPELYVRLSCPRTSGRYILTPSRF